MTGSGEASGIWLTHCSSFATQNGSQTFEILSLTHTQGAVGLFGCCYKCHHYSLHIYYTFFRQSRLYLWLGAGNRVLIPQGLYFSPNRLYVYLRNIKVLSLPLKVIILPLLQSFFSKPWTQRMTSISNLFITLPYPFMF